MGSEELAFAQGARSAIAKRIEAGRGGHDRGALRSPLHLPGHRHLAGRAQRRPRCFLRDIIDLWTLPMLGLLPRPCRRRRLAPPSQLISDIAIPEPSGGCYQQDAVAVALAAVASLDLADERPLTAEERAAGGTISARAASMMTTIRRIGSRSPQIEGRAQALRLIQILRHRCQHLQEATPPAGPRHRVPAEKVDAVACAAAQI